MSYAIIKKEWIKTRLYLAVTFAVTVGMTTYGIMRFGRVIMVKGVDHIWEIMLYKDAVFIENLQYLPLVAGLALAIGQWSPEVQLKRLKLTLHLPIAHSKSVASMVWFMMASLTAIFSVVFLVVGIYLIGIVARELVGHVFITAAPWFLAGYFAYLSATFAFLEPLWRRRIAYALIGCGLVRICFISSVAESYSPVLLPLVGIIILMTFLPHLSVERFRSGI